VVLPAAYDDPHRPADGARPDIGAMPVGGEPLRVGVGGRILAGSVAGLGHMGRGTAASHAGP
jgi:hypothetical protein